MPTAPFAQASARAPQALLGRRPDSGSEIGALAGRTVSMKGAGVGLYLRMLLSEPGIDPRRATHIQDLDGGILSRCFAGGMGDDLLIDLPGALALEVGAVVARFAVTGGNIPWSVYYRLDDWDDGDDRPARFCRALERGMDRILAPEGVAALRPLLARLFPALDTELAVEVVEVVEIYRRAGMWTTPRIDPAAYARWQEGIHGGFLTAAPIPYRELVDSRPAAAFDAET